MLRYLDILDETLYYCIAQIPEMHIYRYITYVGQFPTTEQCDVLYYYYTHSYV